MAKDPAILFYTSDFLTGTILMSMEQRGKYITLLCLQHQKGVLSEQDMMKICSSYDKDVFGKFIKSDAGFYNKRLKEEHEKRSNFSKSRSENRLKGIEKQKLKPKKKTVPSYDYHMENEIEDVNEYEFIESEYKECFVQFLKYRKEIKKPYKNRASIEGIYKELKEKSGNNPDLAKKIVNRSIANQWLGIFKLDDIKGVLQEKKEFT